MMNDKAQMMILESVIFAITIMFALVFLYQLSPTSTIPTTETNDLQQTGTGVLKNLYSEMITDDIPQNFPKNKLVHYLLTDDYKEFILSYLQPSLPPSALYNIYISNGEEKIFWRNAALDNDEPLPLIEPTSVAHFTVSIHPQFLNATRFPEIYTDGYCALAQAFGVEYSYGAGSVGVTPSYHQTLYDIILEMCYV